MKQIHKTRLLTLADYLENLSEDRFDYRRWVASNWDGRTDLKEPSCGTRGCALGHATSVPALRRAGLRLFKPAYDFPGFVGLVGREYHTSGMDKESGEYGPEAAAEKVFGLDKEEYECLFIPNGYGGRDNNPLGANATPKEVAAHIRDFVQNHE